MNKEAICYQSICGHTPRHNYSWTINKEEGDNNEIK